MNQAISHYNQKTTDNVYLNVVFSPPVATYQTNLALPATNTGSQPAIYGDTKTIAIIDKCSDYYCAVISFEISLDEVPLYIVPVIPNQGNPNLTIYIIGILYNGVYYAEPVIYVPDNNLPAPTQNQANQVITPYYYAYTYQNLLNSINTALAEAIADAGLSYNLNPYFYFDITTNLFNLVVPTAFTTGGAAPQIFINDPLQSLLSSFELTYNSTGNNNSQPYGADYFFVLDQPTANQYISYPNVASTSGSVFVQFPEEYPTNQLWISLRKIIVTSNTIPVLKEAIPTFYANGAQSSESNSFPILTDFIPQLLPNTAASDTRSIAYYIPTSQYRLIDMIGDAPLYNLDLRVLWADKDNNLYPILLSTTQESALKLGFFKKSLYKPMNDLLK